MPTRQQLIVSQIKVVMGEYDIGHLTREELNKYLFELAYCLYDKSCPLPI